MRPGIAATFLSVCLAQAAAARAEKVKLLKGPADGEVLAALERVRGQMAVCWQRKPPATVTINLAVAASGEVTKATARTKGTAAQCAAGILAVSTLAPTAKKWSGSVQITTASDKRAQAALAVEQQLRDLDFESCQGKAPDFAGKVMLKLTVGDDGAVTDATASADAAAGNKVATCVARMAKAATFAVDTGVAFEWTLSYGGGGGGGGGGGEADASLKPSKKGPLGGGEIMAAITGSRAALNKCVKKSKAEGKVVIRLVVARDGKVKSAKIKESALDDEKVESCLVVVFTKLAFAAADGETVVHFPLRVDGGAVIMAE
jgi:hypothetical protein